MRAPHSIASHLLVARLVARNTLILPAVDVVDLNTVTALREWE